MSNRDSELRQLVAEIEKHETVENAFLAKSFTDRLVILDVADSDRVPEEITIRLEEHDLRGADEVYSDDKQGSFTGDIGNATRHHFVDVRTRGSHQSYVVE